MQILKLIMWSRLVHPVLESKKPEEFVQLDFLFLGLHHLPDIMNIYELTSQTYLFVVTWVYKEEIDMKIWLATH